MPHSTSPRTPLVLSTRAQRIGLTLALAFTASLGACGSSDAPAQREAEPAEAAGAATPSETPDAASALKPEKQDRRAPDHGVQRGEEGKMGARSDATKRPSPRYAQPSSRSSELGRRPRPALGAADTTTVTAPVGLTDIEGATGSESGASQAQMLLAHYGVGPTIATAETPTSSFAADVDTASYAVLRAHLDRGTLPDPAAVRVEEVVNYFDYHYPPPTTADFSLQAEVVPSPQRKGYHVLHLGIKGKEVSADARAAANLVFVIDVSGSMRGDRLSTVKKSLAMLADQLRSEDTVGIVAYGSSAKVLLEPTSGSNRAAIMAALDGLRAGGSTNLEEGLKLGYGLVAGAKVGAGTNRVILCSDGIANTGATTAETILDRVAQHAQRGITISTIGVGMGGYNDVLMERLADKGDGNYAYVDGLAEARRVFVENLTGTLEVIAKDVKIQIEFDDRVVSRYRLLGYENRSLTTREFADDTKDAGEIGAGHTVTALYEIKLIDPEADAPLGTLRLRYKTPRASASQLIERPLPMGLVRASYSEAAPPTQLSVVAAAYAEKLRGSYWVRNLTWQQVQGMYRQIDSALREEPQVAEFGRLLDLAAKLDNRSDAFEAAAPLARMDFDRVPVLR